VAEGDEDEGGPDEEEEERGGHRRSRRRPLSLSLSLTLSLPMFQLSEHSSSFPKKDLLVLPLLSLYFQRSILSLPIFLGRG